MTSDRELQLTKYNRKRTETNATQHKNPIDAYPELETTMTNLKRERNSDSVIAKVLKWMETQSAPTSNIYFSGVERKYFMQLRRLYKKNGTFYRLYFAQDGKMFYKQLCVPETMLKEVMYTIQNAPNGGHLGIARTIEEFKKRFFCPIFVELVADNIRSCSTYLQMKQVQPSRIRPPLQEVFTLKSFRYEIIQIDILGPFPSSPYKFVLIVVEVFTKYLFATPLTTINALSVATALASIMFQHSYIPQEIFSNLGTQFVSELFHELTHLLEIKISHESLKHSRTIGVVENTSSTNANS